MSQRPSCLARREAIAGELARVDDACNKELAQCCDVARSDLGEVNQLNFN